MDSILVGALVFVCIFAGGLLGMQLYRVLPENHLKSETRDVVKLGIGMISILATLVLGLLTASAKGTFDRADQQIRTYSADLIMLDETLRHYGPQAAPIRANLLAYTDRAVRTTWPESGESQKQIAEDANAGALLDNVAQMVLTLNPTSDDQRFLRTQALTLAGQLVHTRWVLLINEEGTLSPVLLGIMVAWISVIFASFGLNAPRNGTVVAAFFICALSIGTSVFMIMEMDTPLSGSIMISGEPMKSALRHLQAPG